MHEPFRCRACGENCASATRCPRCHGRSFELAPAPEPTRRAEPGGAVLVSLAAVREERGRSRRD